MITIEVTVKAAEPTGAKVVVGGLTEEITPGAEASKVITMANFNITEASTTPPMVDIIITLMGIIEEEVVTAMAIIITEAVVMVEGQNNYHYQYYAHDGSYQSYYTTNWLCN